MRKVPSFDAIIRFVGPATPDQLEHVESFVGEHIGIFIPCTGHCLYALTEDHTHPAFSFYYSYDKKMKMSVGGKIVRSRPNTVSGLPPDVKHHEIPLETFTRFFAILIDPEFFTRHGALYGKQITPLMLATFPLPEQLLPCVKLLMAEISARNPGSPEIIRSLETQITHHLLRSILSLPVSCEKISQREDIDYIVEYINDHYNQSITLDDLAAKIALSRSHFSRLFKRETGFTLQDYIIKVRLERARLMLANSSRKIIEIAHQCGFSSSAHFTAAFSKYAGIQPSAYRKSTRG
jgi:AraC family transcriptional regulator